MAKLFPGDLNKSIHPGILSRIQYLIYSGRSSIHHCFIYRPIAPVNLLLTQPPFMRVAIEKSHLSAGWTTMESSWKWMMKRRCCFFIFFSCSSHTTHPPQTCVTRRAWTYLLTYLITFTERKKMCHWIHISGTSSLLGLVIIRQDTVASAKHFLDEESLFLFFAAPWSFSCQVVCVFILSMAGWDTCSSLSA